MRYAQHARRADELVRGEIGDVGAQKAGLERVHGRARVHQAAAGEVRSAALGFILASACASIMPRVASMSGTWTVR